MARWRRTESLIGQELDSLSDIISFGVAPAVLGFAIGLQGLFDVVILLYFVNCGYLNRLGETFVLSYGIHPFSLSIPSLLSIY